MLSRIVKAYSYNRPDILYTVAMIGHRIREARKIRGYNQQWLAEQVGVSQPSVSDWESGRNDPTMDNLAMAARVLNVHIEWLATGRGQRDYIETAPLASVCQDPAEAYVYTQKTLIPPPSRQETLEGGIAPVPPPAPRPAGFTARGIAQPAGSRAGIKRDLALYPWQIMPKK